MVLLTTRHHLTKELEVGLANGIVQATSRTQDNAPLHHVAKGSGLHRGQDLVGTLHEGWLTNNHLLHELTLQSLSVHQLLQLQVGILLIKLLQGHLIIVGLRVTKFGTALRNLSQFQLQREDILHLLRSCRLTKAISLEHSDNVLLILISNLGCSLIILQVVILHAEGQSALVHTENILRSILLVGTQSGSIELHVTILSHLHLDSEELLHGLG